MYVVGVEKGCTPEPYKSQNKSYEDYDLAYDARRLLADGRVSRGMLEQDKKHRNQLIDRNDVLISLLRLFEKQSKPFVIYRDVNDCPTPVIESVIEWCRKYGLPFREFEEDLWSTHGYIGFRFDEFQTKLRDLYTGYLLWRRVKYEDSSDDNPYRSVTIDECKDMLKLKLACMSFNPQVDFSDVPRLVLGCENLFDMALAQLACLMLDKESFAFCIECNRTFIRYHGSAKLCDTCRPLRYQRTRRKQRAQKKGCETNA